ncbi:MAG TPA: GNAT family N-acetyltransferase [Solirubrobacteraceae bacterium]|nr:GNAT family N-acetyltransferase [Solirubrobacteraceae bacterium]
MTIPADLELRAPAAGDERAIAELVAACDESYRAWTPAGWEPPPPGRELDRWRGRIMDGSWWTRIAVEAGGRVVGLVCFTQALMWVQEDSRAGEPIPHRAHVSAVFTHPDRWREGIATGMLAEAERQMREDGYRDVQLWTPRDAPARRFYEACGWRHDGREQWLDDLALPIVAYVKAL